MIFLGQSGINLTIKADCKQDRDKINKELKCSKIPIYKADTFLYYEIPKTSLDKIYEIWDEEEIQIEPKADEFIKNFRFNNIPLAELKEEEVEYPEGVLPKDYQDFFINRDFRKTEAGVFLETGAGKTFCLIMRAKALGFNKMLIFSTKNNFEDWSSDLNWLLGKSVIQYTGTKKQRDKIDLSSHDIVFTNYEQAKEIKERFKADCLVLDESQECSNPDTKTHKDIVSLIRLQKPRIRLLSTATPIENKLDELWGLMYLLNPAIAGDRKHFLSKFQRVLRWTEIEYTRNGKQLVHRVPAEIEYINTTELKRLISTMFYRKDITEHYKFEDKSEVVHLDMTPKQAELYDQVKEEIYLALDKGEFYLDSPMVRAMRLIQAAESTIHFIDEYESNKLDWTKKFILDNPDLKIIVWDKFKHSTNKLQEDMPDTCVAFNGDIPDKLKKLHKLAFAGTRNEKEEKQFYDLLALYPDFPFKTPGSARVLAATTNASQSAGMNLPAASVQIVMCVDPSARATKQFLGRCKRVNTEHEVVRSIFLVSKGTIEYRLLKLVFNKIKNMSSLLDGEGALQELKARDIIGLLREEK